MKKHELTLTNFYIENKNKILSQTDINEMKLKHWFLLSNLKIDIDKISFDFSAINTFNFKINTFRGINIGNHFNLGQFISNRNLYGKNPILKNSKIKMIR